MKCLGVVLLCSLALLTASARAETISIEPGQWKVTSKTVVNGGAMPPKVTMSCLSADQAGDVTKGLGPTMGTVNSTCASTEFQIKVGQMKWRLQCKGQIDIDLLGDYTFDSMSHYTATVLSKAWMGGAQVSDVKTELEGERVGACPQ
jgi:hypothetical protein